MMRKRAFLFSVCAGVSLFCLSGGAAEAACIQTPTCSSLGYTSTSSCTGGTKCPFGNYWNCTGPNNTTEINNLKTEISNIKTDITNIKTNITNLTNRITNIENNSSSNQYSDKCIGCEVGMYYDGTKCYTFGEIAYSGMHMLRYISDKKDGKCYYQPYNGWTEISYNEWLKLKDGEDIEGRIATICSVQSIFNVFFNIMATKEVLIKEYENIYSAEIYITSCGDENIRVESSEPGQSLEDFKNSLTVPWLPETQTF